MKGRCTKADLKIMQRGQIKEEFSVGVIPRIDLDVLTPNVSQDTFDCGEENDTKSGYLKHEYSAGSIW